jgi:hypothetical protein
MEARTESTLTKDFREHAELIASYIENILVITTYAEIRRARGDLVIRMIRQVARIGDCLFNTKPEGMSDTEFLLQLLKIEN